MKANIFTRYFSMRPARLWYVVFPAVVMVILMLQPAIAEAGPATQGTQTSSGTGYQTIIVLILGAVSIIGGIIMRFTYASVAPSYDERINASYPVNRILAEVGVLFPERQLFGRPWKYERTPQDYNRLKLSAYPFPYACFCCLIPLTGLIFGAIGWLIMGRQDFVNIVIEQKEQGGSLVSIEASGYSAVSKARTLAAKLNLEIP